MAATKEETQKKSIENESEKELEELLLEKKKLLLQKEIRDLKKDEEKENDPSVYETLSKIDVKPFLEKKNGLDYLSWSKAWGLAKSAYPDINYEVTEYPEYVLTQQGYVSTGRMVDYRATQAGVEVEVTVKIKNEKYSSKLYVMNFKNKSIPINKATLFEINKTQLRALVKALAFAGLGLSVYAGEDLPISDDDVKKFAKDKTDNSRTTSQQGYSSYPQARSNQPYQQPSYKKDNSLPTPPQKGINGFKSFEEVKKSKAEYPAGSGNFTTLEEIWNKALAGDLEASGWWRDTSKLNNSDGVAVKAYTEYFNLAKRNKQTA